MTQQPVKTEFMAALHISPDNMRDGNVNIQALFQHLAKDPERGVNNIEFRRALHEIFAEIIKQSMRSTMVKHPDLLVDYTSFRFITTRELVTDGLIPTTVISNVIQRIEQSTNDGSNLNTDVSEDKEAIAMKKLDEARYKEYARYLKEMRSHLMAHFLSAKLLPYAGQVASENPILVSSIFNADNIAKIIRELMLVSLNFDAAFYDIMKDNYIIDPLSKSIYHAAVDAEDQISKYANYHKGIDVVDMPRSEYKYDNKPFKNELEAFYFFYRWTYTDPVRYEKIKGMFLRSKPESFNPTEAIKDMVRGIGVAVEVFIRKNKQKIGGSKISQGIDMIVGKLKNVYGEAVFLSALRQYYNSDDASEETLMSKIHMIAHNAERMQEFDISTAQYSLEG